MPAASQVNIKHPNAFYIGGEWVAPSASGTLDVVDSATEEVFVSVAEAQQEDVDRAVAAARKAFDEGPWPRMTPPERAGYLRALGRELTAHAPDVARLWTLESGITHNLSSMNAGGIEGLFTLYADMAESFPFVEEHKPIAGNVGLLVREPVGVTGVIIPWNGPMMSIAIKCTPALLAGCTIIIKASPEAPASVYLFAELCEKVGIPRGVVNIITAEREVSELLVKHPGVDKITFTGSTAAGRRIGSLCGERVARCTLELGGKSAAVVLDDYDVEKAAQAIAETGAMLTGQACGLLTRVVVSRNRHAAMLDALSAAYGSVRVGDPFAPETQMGPLAMARQREKVEGLIGTAISEGATLAAGGGRPAHLDRGYFVEPTVFGNVTNDMTIAREEVFGPVLSVIPAADEEDAIRIANDSIYGLNGAVFTNDADRAYQVSRRVRTGTMGHNALRFDFTIAFGGFKQSGIGREGGREGLYPFLETKTIVLDGTPSHY